MILGFIGCGKISYSVITGILSSKLNIKKIYISKRNYKISSHLRKKYKNIIVSNNNQEILIKVIGYF